METPHRLAAHRMPAMLLSRRSWLVLLAATLGGARRAFADSDARTKAIYVQPLADKLTDQEVAFVQKSLTAFFDVRVPVLPRVPLPPAAYYAPRNRHRAE